MPDGLLKVDKGVPLPAPRSGKMSNWPFAEMEVGDSFFVTQITLTGILSAARKFKPMRFTARSVVENGVRGIRIWRVT